MGSLIRDTVLDCHDIQEINLNGSQGDFVTKLYANVEGKPCITRIDVVFQYKHNGRSRLAGEATVFIVDRKYRHRGSPKTWVDFLLQVPDGYMPGELDLHEAEDDELTTLEKCLMWLYDSRGRPRPGFPALHSDRIAFIDTFRLENAFSGGKGFAQVAMEGLFRGMAKLPGKLAFQGTYFLSPAPIDEAAEERGLDLDTCTVVQWHRAVEKLIRSYERTGFEVWKEGDKRRGWTLTIMGMDYAPPGPMDHLHDTEATCIPTAPGTTLSQPDMPRLPLCENLVRTIPKLAPDEWLEHWFGTNVAAQEAFITHFHPDEATPAEAIEAPPDLEPIQEDSSPSRFKWELSTPIRRLAGLRLPDADIQSVARHVPLPSSDGSGDGYVSPSKRPAKRRRPDFQ